MVKTQKAIEKCNHCGRHKWRRQWHSKGAEPEALRSILNNPLGYGVQPVTCPRCQKAKGQLASHTPPVVSGGFRKVRLVG